MKQTSNSSSEGGNTLYVVLMDKEERHSLWLSSRKIPQGWQQIGEPGSKEFCLDYIKKNWTDMRPLSLRQKTS